MKFASKHAKDHAMNANATPAHDPLQFGEAVLRLRAHRHELLSANLVNADTPGFKSRDVDFPNVLAKQLAGGLPPQAAEAMKRTHSAHLAGRSAETGPVALYRVPVQPSVDGNTVDPDIERGHFVKNAFMTEGALSFLGSTLRSRLSAITGQAS
jgi:flagellar basal-body rod protein FlgB